MNERQFSAYYPHVLQTIEALHSKEKDGEIDERYERYCTTA